MRKPGGLILVLMLLTGCASTREIETAPPRPIRPVPAVHEPIAGEARLSVLFQKGMTDLPGDVDLLRFRVGEVHLHDVDGEWLRLPSDLHMVELHRGRTAARRTVLDARIPAAAYDSLAIVFDRIFAQFGENAGAALTVGNGTPHKMALELEATATEHSVILLNFEAGPSLSRTPDCRWYFVPLLRPEFILTPQ